MSKWEFRPARDQALSPAAQAISSVREPGLVSTLGVAISTTLSLTYLKLYHGYRAHGVEHLPTQTPFVLVANHSSHLDHACLRNALPLSLRVRTMPLAAGDVFFTSAVKAAMATRLIGALPMWRKKVGPKALAELRERLEARDVGFVLFPEGARTRDGQLLKLKAGIGMLVAGLDVPVVPAWIDGAFHALRPETWVPRPVRVNVRFGPALRFPTASNDREGWEQVLTDVEAAIKALRPQA